MGQAFLGDPNNERVFYEADADGGYILDTGNDDVRSEGMSYGMMIAVQMDQKATFDRLWRWTVNQMRHSMGARVGYFAWQLGKDGQIRDPNPASDAEVYFATALLFAAARWPQGPIDYATEAQSILDVMLHKEDGGVVDSVMNMFNKDKKMVVFTPYASAATFTNPSYHLPAFYEIWARKATRDSTFWSEAATASRAFFQTTVNAQTGLAPDYAEFSGAPSGSGHQEFRFDAWRVISNIAVDYQWWKANGWAVEESRRLLDFFRTQGISNYGNQFNLDGSSLSGDHSPGLVSMNALAALALPAPEGQDFVQE